MVTLGNHTYRRSGIGAYLAASDRVIRPANQGAQTPGSGLAVVEARNGVRVAVLNLLGQLFLDTPVSPWEVVDALVEEARAAAPVVVVDFHAEATSEKVALADLARRPRHRRDRHAHARADERRARPARRHGCDHATPG